MIELKPQKDISREMFPSLQANYPEAMRLIIKRIYDELRANEPYGDDANEAFWFRVIDEIKKSNTPNLSRPSLKRLIQTALHAPHQDANKYKPAELEKAAENLVNSLKTFLQKHK